MKSSRTISNQPASHSLILQFAGSHWSYRNVLKKRPILSLAKTANVTTKISNLDQLGRAANVASAASVTFPSSVYHNQATSEWLIPGKRYMRIYENLSFIDDRTATKTNDKSCCKRGVGGLQSGIKWLTWSRFYLDVCLGTINKL